MKRITHINVKYKTIKLLEDTMGENLEDLGYGDGFIDSTPKTQSVKEVIDKLDYIKIKNFFSAKNNAKRMRRQATDWEKIFKDTSDKRPLSKISKELLKLHKKKQPDFKMVQRP